MQMGHYREAAGRFADPMWKGMAYYYAEEFMLAAEYFSRRDSDDALFNEANARAHARDYMRAVNRYDRLLARTRTIPARPRTGSVCRILSMRSTASAKASKQEAGRQWRGQGTGRRRRHSRRGSG